jgi:radical SAM protein with 4Fe4S-binding SPASM domain
MDRKPGLLSFDLVGKMFERGDFGGTTFIELQQAGEPTIHPRLGEIIQFLKGTVRLMVGLSTHGLNFRKPGVLAAVLELDTVTISIDSTDPVVYHKMRYPAKLEDLFKSLDAFFATMIARRDGGFRVPLVDLQLVKTPLVAGSGDLGALSDVVREKGWDNFVRVRMVEDSFMEADGRMIMGTMPRPRNGDICINPFSSVSVNEKGDVLSCCQIFDPDKTGVNYYGNLYEESLADIWNGPRVGEMRRQHREGKLSGQCMTCYTWSPTRNHSNIIQALVRHNR